jgi:hypothetical protein
MSFSAEMRDFLTAYKTGQGINASRTDQDYKEAKTKAENLKTERDNDPETLKLATDQAKATLAATQQRMGLAAAARGDASKNAALSREIATERLRQLRAAGQDPGSGLFPPGAIQPAVGPPAPGAGVLPVSPPTIDTGEDAYAEGGLVTGDPNDPPARFVREEPKPPKKRERGVLDTLTEKQYETNPDGSPKRDADGKIVPVRRYADGGLVDDESTEDASLPDEAEPTQGVLPMTAEGVPAGAPTDVSARSRGVPRGLEGIISPQLVDDARRAGLTWGIEKAGLHQGAVRTPAALAKARAIAQGQGGLTPQEMEAAKQAVDPQGKMTESQRNLAALGSVYQFWANKGDPERAQRVAFQMMQNYRATSQRYAAIAAKAAEGGNMDLATKAALKAYQNVPDGKDLEIAPNPDGGLMYTYTDEKGDVIAKGVATPQQLASSAMGLATGGFDKALMQAAGATPEAPKPGKAGAVQSASDRDKEATSIGGAVEALKTQWAAKNKDQPLDDNHWSEVANTAQHLYQQNRSATPNEVAAAANEIFKPDAKGDWEKPNFKVKPGEEGQPSTLDFGGKLKLKVDDDTRDAIINARAARVKAAADKIDADMTASEQPGVLDKVGEGAARIAKGVAETGGPAGVVTGIASKIGNTAYDALKAIYGDHIPQSVVDAVQSTKDKVKGAAGAVGDAVSDAVSNKGAIPVDENDRPL